MKSKNRNDSHIIVTGQGEHETTSHDFASNNVLWPIRIFHCASIEQVCSNFARVKDNDGLTGRVEVDEIA